MFNSQLIFVYYSKIIIWKNLPTLQKCCSLYENIPSKPHNKKYVVFSILSNCQSFLVIFAKTWHLVQLTSTTKRSITPRRNSKASHSNLCSILRFVKLPNPSRIVFTSQHLAKLSSSNAKRLLTPRGNSSKASHFKHV